MCKNSIFHDLCRQSGHVISMILPWDSMGRKPVAASRPRWRSGSKVSTVRDSSAFVAVLRASTVGVGAVVGQGVSPDSASSSRQRALSGEWWSNLRPVGRSLRAVHRAVFEVAAEIPAVERLSGRWVRT